MRKWILVATATALLAISGGVAFASWGGGSGSDAVSVEGTARLDGTKYYIDGNLTSLCDPNIQCNVTPVANSTWLLDFGAANYYLDNPGDDCAAEVAYFLANLASQHTIDGKLAEHGEIDVYRVDDGWDDGCDLRSGEEGGAPPWADSDSDGFDDDDELSIGTDPNDPCGNDGWPSDLFDGLGSENKVNLQDVTSFVMGTPPFKFGSVKGGPGYDERWNLFNGGASVDVIDLQDITAIVTGSRDRPPMLGGARAFDGPACPWPA